MYKKIFFIFFLPTLTYAMELSTKKAKKVKPHSPAPLVALAAKVIKNSNVPKIINENNLDQTAIKLDAVYQQIGREHAEHYCTNDLRKSLSICLPTKKARIFI